MRSREAARRAGRPRSVPAAGARPRGNGRSARRAPERSASIWNGRTGRRTATPEVVVIAAVTAAVVAAAGGGEVLLLAPPAVLLAVTRMRTRAGAVASAAVVFSAAVAGSVAVRGAGPRPSIVLLAVACAACAAVLVVARERLERERDILRDFALTDPVTGVANRRSLLMRAEYEIARHSRAGRTFALVMLDLDGFKGLNDRFGHAAGDDLLRDVAAAVRRAMRAQDTVARFGGDEFCVLAPETDARGIEGLAARVGAAVRDVSVGMESVGGSVGVALFPEDGETPAELMAAADERLLEAKRRRPASRRAQRRAA